VTIRIHEGAISEAKLAWGALAIPVDDLDPILDLEDDDAPFVVHDHEVRVADFVPVYQLGLGVDGAFVGEESQRLADELLGFVGRLAVDLRCHGLVPCSSFLLPGSSFSFLAPHGLEHCAQLRRCTQNEAPAAP
jgi:hypothetical protein